MSELNQKIKDVIENEPVALFMKGTPQFVMCGNSDRALRALRDQGAPVAAVNILPDPAIRQELAESGELTKILEERLGSDYRSAAEERVVDVLEAPAQR